MSIVADVYTRNKDGRKEVGQNIKAQVHQLREEELTPSAEVTHPSLFCLPFIYLCQ